MKITQENKTKAVCDKCDISNFQRKMKVGNLFLKTDIATFYFITIDFMFNENMAFFSLRLGENNSFRYYLWPSNYRGNMNNDKTRGKEHFKIANYVSNMDIQLLILRITFYNFEIPNVVHFQKWVICTLKSFFIS